MATFARLWATAERRRALALAAAVVAADQIVKWWVVTRLMQPPRVIEITPFFNMRMVWNQGVTFGLFASGAGGAARWLLVAVSVAVVAALGVWLARIQRQPWVAAALGSVIGGALGNVVDRLNYGKVADFLDFHALGWHWPAFNLADCAIVVGVAILLLDAFIGRRE